MVLNAQFRKLEISEIKYLSFKLKKIEEEKIKTRVSRGQIIRIKEDVSEIEKINHTKK